MAKCWHAQSAYMAHVNKMNFLIHHMLGSLLRCAYCTCSYCDDDKNSIYRAALIGGSAFLKVTQLLSPNPLSSLHTVRDIAEFYC